MVIQYSIGSSQCHTFFGYSQRRNNLLKRGIAKYVRPITNIIFINKLKSNGCYPKKKLRIYCANELIQYEPMNATIVIFHLGGATIAFKAGRVNQVSRPVAFCEYRLE